MTKLKKLWRKLLKAESRHKERKAAKLEHKLLKSTLAAKREESSK